MSASSLFRNVRRWFRQPPTRPAGRPRRSTLRFEALEDRSVPTATLGVTPGGVLQFQGTTVGDVVGVWYANNTYTFRDLTEPIAYNNNPPSEWATVPTGGFNSIEIDGGDATNVFYIISTAHPLVVNGGAANDTVMVGNDINTIGGLVTVHGGGGYNTVSVSDYGGPGVGHSYSVYDDMIGRDFVNKVAYDSQVQAVWLNPGTADNSVRVYGTAATAQTQITMQPTGSDSIVVGGAGDTLDTIHGVLVVAGSDGSLGRHDDLTMDDLGSANGNTYQLGTWGVPVGGAMSLSRNGQLLVSAGGLRQCELDAGAGNDTVNVVGTESGTTTIVHAGFGDDDVEVGDPYHGLDYMFGPLVVDGGTPDYGDKLHINDASAAAGHDYYLSASEFDRTTDNGNQQILYSNFRTIQIDTSSFNDRFVVAGTPAGSTVSANLGGGNDTIESTTATNDYYLTGVNQGNMTCADGALSFTSAENIMGWIGADVVHFIPGGGLSGNITDTVGGHGLLDYSAWTDPVRVNLELQTASAVGGVVIGFENVTGGSGNDLIVGDDQPNTLRGGAGNNVLVGGGGLDNIIGGPDSDLIIGGTAFNYDQASLDAVWLEWTNPNDLFMDKLGHLSGASGGLNGTVYLIGGQTVISDGLANNLFGNGGNDWIWT
jgi:hypothetical protein